MGHDSSAELPDVRDKLCCPWFKEGLLSGCIAFLL